MIQSRREHLSLLSAFALGQSGHAATDFATWTDAQKERFLTTARIVSAEAIGHGVTKPVKVEMAAGGVSHAAKIQIVDKELPDFFGESGPPVPMRDSWHFNIAAYRIDRLLQLNMVTVAVPRTYKNKPAGFSWWVDNVMFEEVDRIKKDIKPPDPEAFDRQRALMRVFDELIINIDRNLSNLLITKTWQVALIDHSRSFTPYHEIRNRANLTRCSRALIARMRSLDTAAITTVVEKHLTAKEVAAVLARRDRIVAFFEQRVREQGEQDVLFA